MKSKKVYLVLLRCGRETGIERYAKNIASQLTDVEEYVVITNKKYNDKLGLAGNTLLLPNNDILAEFIYLPIFALFNRNAVFFFPLFPPMLPFWCVPGIRVIRTVFDAVPWDLVNSTTIIAKLFYRLPERIALNRANSIITISRFSKARLGQLVGEGKNSAKIVNCSMGPGLVVSAPESTTPKSNFFLAVGTIEPRKNYEFLLSVFSKYIEDGGDCDLYIAGRLGWKVSSTFEKLSAQLQRDGRLKLMHHVSDDELIALYRNCRSLLMPSLYEGLGLPVIEGLMANTDVIASDIPVFHEISSDIKFVAVNDLEAWVDALMVAPIKRSVKTLLQSYSWTDTGQRVKKVLENEKKY